MNAATYTNIRGTHIYSRSLYLFTGNFPFAPGEDFLGEEIEILASKFEHCYIVPTNYIKSGSFQRKLPKNVKVICSTKMFSNTFFKVLKLIEEILRNPKIIITSIASVMRNSKGKLSLKQFFQEIKYVSQVKAVARSILAQVAATCPSPNSSIFYAYWLHTPASVALQIKTELNLTEMCVVSRAHGFDVYENRNPTNYLPQREELLRNLDQIAFVSNAGLNHLTELFPEHINKFTQFRLGVNKSKYPLHKTNFNYSIVSCSYLQEVKRIELIPHVLKVLNDQGLKLQWTHIGGGTVAQEQNLIDLVRNEIPDLEFVLTGHLSNVEVKNMLSFNSFDLFINVSSSEGVPVAGMEALAGGLPLLMTNVGGSSELINIEKGMFEGLLPSNPKVGEIARKILHFYSEPFPKILQYSIGSKRAWENNWNSNKNYKKFANFLLTFK